MKKIYIDKHGYIIIGSKPLHKIVCEINDINTRDLHIHHIDKNKLNNSLDNLLVCTASEHMSIHMNSRSEEAVRKCNGGRGKKRVQKNKEKWIENLKRSCKGIPKSFRGKTWIVDSVTKKRKWVSKEDVK